MSAIGNLRAVLAALPVSDAALEEVSDLLNKVEHENTAGAASVIAIQSMSKVIESGQTRRSEACPLCHRARGHTEVCYLRPSVGWDLLEEHEATLVENSELRDALAKHLPVNGAAIRAGGSYRSLKDRAKLQSGGGE